MKKSTTFLLTGGAAALLTSMALLNGCTGDSAEGFVRSAGLIVEGFYAHSDSGSKMVQRTSGADVTSMNISQSGDQLQGFDNNGVYFSGTIGQVVDTNRATFILEGQSTIGQPATITGNISVDGTTATMRGTWIEPSLASEVFAVATVPTNAPPPTASTNDVVTLNQTLVSLTVGDTTSFSASGGTGDYTWRVANTSQGNLSGISGSRNSSATYLAGRAGNNTVTVTDGAGQSASATVQQSTTPTDTPTAAAAVTLNQSLVTINSLGGTTSFTASGGTGNIQWSVANGFLGQFSSQSGSRNTSATYQASGLEGQQTITARDSATGSRATATINQVAGSISTNIFFPPIPGT